MQVEQTSAVDVTVGQGFVVVSQDSFSAIVVELGVLVMFGLSRRVWVGVIHEEKSREDGIRQHNERTLGSM